MASAVLDLKLDIKTQLSEEITVEVGDSRIVVPRARLISALFDDILGSTPKVAPEFRMPSLGEDEYYAGILLGKNDRAAHHLILLPSEIEAADWKRATTWSQSIGGELPTRREQALLYANLPEQFKSAYYWSDEQHAENADYAWSQNFGDGSQSCYRKHFECRARAVRRLMIQ